MSQKTISASKFKAQCLGMLDEIAATGEEVVVTKRGKPVARVGPIEPPPSLRGSVTYHISDEELIAPLPDVWNANVE